MITDPIGDFLTRIRNAQLRKEATVVVPSTNMLVAISEILKKEGFIAGFEIEKNEIQNSLVINLKYVNGVPAIRELTRVSKPGIRKYRGYKEIQVVRNGQGVSIFSTPNGIVTGEDAKKQKIGGEFLCYVY